MLPSQFKKVRVSEVSLSLTIQSRILPKDPRSYRQLMEQGPSLFTFFEGDLRLPLFLYTQRYTLLHKNTIIKIFIKVNFSLIINRLERGGISCGVNMSRCLQLFVAMKGNTAGSNIGNILIMNKYLFVSPALHKFR